MKCVALRIRLVAIAVLAAFVVAGCVTGTNVSPAVTTITPEQMQSLAADVGYLAYEFTPAASTVQPILAGVCLIDTTQDPVAIAQELQQLVSKVWSGINAIGTPGATIIVLLINNLVTDLGLNADLTAATTNISPYIVSAVVGLCQGVQAAQTGNMPKELKASLAARGVIPIPMGLPPAMVVPGNYSPSNIGVWNRIKNFF